ncbi:MAG: MaoC family dehydratase [Psychrobacter sp.]|nr:MaoC family dehydratase [Psychrobacter sp.]
MEKQYLEDLKVGDKWISREQVINSDDIKAFAKDYDPQPFHLDEAAAKDTFFAGLAASGWQTASITMRLMVETIPIATGLIGAGGQISWPRPTRPGDSLHMVAEVIEIKPSRSKPDRGIVTVQIDTLNQEGEAVQTFTCNMLAFRRSNR